MIETATIAAYGTQKGSTLHMARCVVVVAKQTISKQSARGCRNSGKARGH